MKFRLSPVIGIPLSILLFLSACALFSQVYTLSLIHISEPTRPY